MISIETAILLAALAFFIGFCCGEWREFKLWIDADKDHQ